MGDYRQHGYLGKGLLPTLKKYTTDIDGSLPKVQCSNVIEIINPKEVICIHKEADAEL